MRLFAMAVATMLLGCGPGYASSEPEYTPSEYHAANASASRDYRREVETVGVYEGLYENEAAIKHYCGDGAGVTDARAWVDACDARLNRVYWGRVKTQYKYADWSDVENYCDLKPNECATPKGFDAAIRSSHISGAQRQNHLRSQQIESERAAAIEAKQAAQRKFTQALICATMELSSEEAGARCRGQRVVRCKTQLRVIGMEATADEVCIETPAREE